MGLNRVLDVDDPIVTHLIGICAPTGYLFSCIGNKYHLVDSSSPSFVCGESVDSPTARHFQMAPMGSICSECMVKSQK